MNFAGIEFALLMATVFVVYWGLLHRSLRAQNSLLLAASMIFYGWWDWRFLGLLCGVIAVSYVAGLKAAGAHGRRWAAAGIAVIVGVLVAFKYFGFFSDNLLKLLALLGIDGLDWFTVEVLLPVGLSFYTFQAISYIVDVRRGLTAPCRRLDTFALYLSFFPQLVAGPIERSSALLPQFERPRRWARPQAALGARQMLWGLAKKVVIADTCAFYVDRYMAELDTGGWGVATAAVLLFSVQIYADFSGYCDIARGAARCLGIELMQNFRFPYFATDIRQFWRRWNASLMQWLRDYIYIPLGGSRCSRKRHLANLLIVFAVSGLWHGAAWTFIVWGLAWGILSIAYTLWGKKIPAGPRHAFGRAATLAAAAAGWALFRSDSMHQAAQLLSLSAAPIAALAVVAAGLMCLNIRIAARTMSVLCGAIAAAVAVGMIAFPDPVAMLAVRFYLPAMIILMFVVEWYNRHCEYVMQRWSAPQWVRTAVYICLILMVWMSSFEDVPFIYFRF